MTCRLRQIDSDAKQWLNDVFASRVLFDEPMSRHTSFRVGGPADAYVIPKNPVELNKLVPEACQRNIKYFIIGGGTNLLVRDGGIRGIVIDLKKYFNGINSIESSSEEIGISVMAGTPLKQLCKYALLKGLDGLNPLLGIPGTVGGALVMNAGTSRGSIGSVLEAIDVLLPEGDRVRISKDQLEFCYRQIRFKDCLHPLNSAVILSGDFRLYKTDSQALHREAREIVRYRHQRQPLGVSSAGCFFKNPPQGKSAGELIDIAGLKGMRIGDAKVSDKHANFIINCGNARATDILDLAELIGDHVKKRFDVELEGEVKIVGESFGPT